MGDVLKRQVYVEKGTENKVFVLGSAKSAKNADVKVVIYAELFKEEENIILNKNEFFEKYELATK